MKIRLIRLTSIFCLLFSSLAQNARSVQALNQIVIYLPVVSRSNQNPNIPSKPMPDDKSTDTGWDFGWNGGDPDGDAVTYTVYLDSNNPPTTMVVDDLVDSRFQTVPLDPDIRTINLQLTNFTTYYWQVISKDSHGATTSGPIWSFFLYIPSCQCGS